MNFSKVLKNKKICERMFLEGKDSFTQIRANTGENASTCSY